MRKTQRLLAFSALVLASTLLAWLFGEPLGQLTGLRSFEDFTLDLRQQTTPESFRPGQGDRESEVVLVLFDEETFNASTWISPMPRAHLASLVDAVAGAGARTIGIDVYLDLLWPTLNEIDQGDDLLREAIERAGNVVLVTPMLRTDSGYVSAPPHPFFSEVAAAVGTAELPASYETFRDATLLVRTADGLAPSFALAMYAHARGLDLDSLLAETEAQGRVDLPGLPVDVATLPESWSSASAALDDPILPFRIHYVGPPSGTLESDPPGTFYATGSSIADMVAMLTPETFQDKIVLLGTGFHSEDRFRTPFYGYEVVTEPGAPSERYEWMYGVEIHANALQNIIDGAYVSRLPGVLVLLILLAGAALTAGTVFVRGAAWGAAASFAAIAATWVVAYWVWAGVVYLPGFTSPRFASVGTWMPIGTPILAAMLGYVQSVAYTAIVEGREKRFIKGAFGKYLSPDVVAEISEDPSALTLGGEKRPLSLLFSDLSGFTSISEDMDAEELIALLNEYLHDMTQVVFEENGYLDKYIGDAIMAFWNAPKEVPDHADRAMRTAIFMQRRMNALNERWAEADPEHVPLMVRIGVHTGEVVVGNVGGEERFDYSAIGDAVNLAARLEPANKTYDTLNMVSGVTLEAGEGEYRVRELDYIAVKGKDEPVKVYELLELAGETLPPDKEAALEHYSAGMTAYKQHDWAGAKTHFEAGIAACPNDGPCILYATRCQENIEDPPPPDWDFVVRRTEK